MQFSRFRIASAAVAALAAVSGSAAFAQWDEDDLRYAGNSNGWVTIGEKSVNGQVDFDRIQVRGNERFRKIRVCALNRPFELRNLSANYANGGSQQFLTGMIVPAGTCTRKFDLAGKRRNITNVHLTYSRLGWGSDRPRLIVQARY